jgi:hypothetical protein
MKQHMEWLGYKVEDVVTGFAGVATSLSFDLYGCVQVVVTPPVDGKGVVPDGRWFDITRLKRTSGAPVMAVPTFEKFNAPGPAEKPARQ